MNSLRDNYNSANKLATLVFQDAQHLQRFLDHITEWCVGNLHKVQSLIHPPTEDDRIVMGWGLQNQTFPNMCALSQEMISTAFQCEGINHKPFLSNVFKSGLFNHCVTVLPFTFADKPETQNFALLDPTFNQFQMPREIFRHSGIPEIYAGKQPKFILDKTETGRDIWEKLTTQKHLVLDQAIAGEYLGSLFWRDHFSNDRAFNVLTNQPPVEHQLQHGLSRVLQIVGTLPDLHAVFRETQVSSVVKTQVFAPIPG